MDRIKRLMLITVNPVEVKKGQVKVDELEEMGKLKY